MMCFATGILIEGSGLLHRPAETLFNGFDRGQHRAALPSFPMAFLRRKGVGFDLTLEAAGCHLAHILTCHFLACCDAGGCLATLLDGAWTQTS